MSQTLSVQQAATNLEALISNLRPGEEITLTLGDKPVAKIIPQTLPRRRGGACKGLLIENNSIPEDAHLADFREYMG